eukprot:9725717-Alexandrium_andersonii.AAC.1
MSASLVGSEMCIRDRNLADLFAEHIERIEIDPCLERSLCPACAASVSYTHLTLPTICSV